MRLTVLSVAYPLAPVGPDAVGGAERILSELDRALVARGDVSLVAACEGSEPAGELFAASLPETECVDEAAKALAVANLQSAIDRALVSRRVDLIHCHAFDFHRYTFPADVPVLVTLHLPIEWHPSDVWRRYAGRVRFQLVSHAQRRSAPSELRSAPVIANGVAIPPPSRASKRDFALVMGRICPEKNQHAALEAGAIAGIRVCLGGQVFPYPEHRAYFHEKIEPLLRGGFHKFLGPIAGERKASLLARARCMLHPTLAPETSSLVTMEALAAGTPVIAYPSGALSEIIEDGVNGFLVGGVAEMAEAIAKADEIRPEDCRRSAERFSLDSMLGEYFALYERLVVGRCAEVHA